MRVVADPVELAGRALATATPEAIARADWGVPLLARLTTGIATGRTSGPSASTTDTDTRPVGATVDEDGPQVEATVRRTVLAWVAQRRHGVSAARLFGGGLASLLTGLTHACAVEPRLRTVADLCRAQLVAWCRHRSSPDGPLAVDYDLVSGVSGAVLALTTTPGCRPEHLRPGLGYLLTLCAGPDLAGLRHSSRESDPRLRWNIGQLNQGLAHGVPGVLAALVAAHPLVSGAERDELSGAIGRLAGHLCRSAFRDERGVLTWRRGSTEESADPRRQAWCYGAPGVAWQLAEAGRVLGDPAVADLARESMASLCAVWDDDYYLRAESVTAQLTICHGAPGILAVARAFADHLGLSAARTLERHLRDQVAQRLTRWYDSTSAAATMLDGTAGTLSVLLTDDPATRAWLAPLALR
ncbi:hypothetical protein GCM10027290_59320 [Micromonospora sonneratiae]|uniref:Lanthionine synthetase LanC family protein n=1 Tax=Micromonospora sonneratiae TaxID=1184706 RepID=A0ABW3Y6F0_9ACTN